MPLSDLDLERLARLRGRFLSAGAAPARVADYWAEPEDLEHYDAVFAQRIGWKWDAALDEIDERAPIPARLENVVDWGCGTGVAGRRVAARTAVGRVLVHDRSAAAMDYALARYEELGQSAARAGEHRDAEIDLLVVSHLLDELDARTLDHLLQVVARSRRVWWVEAGTKAVSHALGRIRDKLAADFAIVAPCTHGGACPVFADEAAAEHWCHFFAEPPVEVFQDPDWVKLARAIGIDLRALPYSLLALAADETPRPAPGPRLLGRPRVGNKLAHCFTCDGKRGIERHEVVKNRARDAYRLLKKGPGRWIRPGALP